jgi:hypothetical protein
MKSIIRDNFTFSFPSWIYFIYFSCFVVLARTSSIMLNRNDQSEYLCLVPDLRRKEFTFSPLRMMLAMDLSYVNFIMLRHIFVEFFLIKKEC